MTFVTAGLEDLTSFGLRVVHAYTSHTYTQNEDSRTLNVTLTSEENRTRYGGACLQPHLGVGEGEDKSSESLSTTQ